MNSPPHVQILRFQGQRKRLLFVGKWQNGSSGGRSKFPSGHAEPTALLLGAPIPRCKLVPVPLALCPNDASSLGPPRPSHHKWVSPTLCFLALYCVGMTHNYLHACLEPPSPPTCKLHGDRVLPQRCHSAHAVLTRSFQNHRLKTDQESACPQVPWLDQRASENSLAGLVLL